MSRTKNKPVAARRTLLRAAGVAAAGLLSGCLGQKRADETPESEVSPDRTVSESVNSITLYKDPTCSCCSEYVGYLEEKLGTSVAVVDKVDMSGIKTEYGIPENMLSCHTVDLGDYFVEGHVPYKVVDSLLREAPEIAGIALPEMPSGSPGMPGEKTGEWTIYSVLDDGSVKEFATV
ncbi:DUF411 domain-containing protein [Haloarchaeobius sp. DFWS5]|uniref:DUF411 domain-containing protein n=1 Tax=Haloarchaeobius sp. DFWS5 TaxID=3446114 RepID=UPI003EB7663B